MITIGLDNIEIKTPSRYEIGVQTLVDAQRNAYGVMIGRVVRESVVRIDLEWKYLTTEEWRDIIRNFKRNEYDTSAGFVNTIGFVDPETGERIFRQMYVGDRRAKAIKIDAEGNPTAFVDCALALIEV